MSKQQRSKHAREAAHAAPRNPLVAPALFRKAGSHEKRRGAVRRAERMALKREAGGFAASLPAAC